MLLATDFVHSCTAGWAFALHCRFAIFHSDFYCIRIFSLRATFYTIHTCHSFIHLLSKKCYLRIAKYKINSTDIAIPASISVLRRSFLIARTSVSFWTCSSFAFFCWFVVKEYEFELFGRSKMDWLSSNRNAGIFRLLRCAIIFSFLVFLGII